MGKYSQLAEELLKAHKFRSPADAESIVEEATTALRELEAENEELAMDNELLKQGVNPVVYCELCGSCGEDGCCPPERCLLRKAEAQQDRLRDIYDYVAVELHKAEKENEELRTKYAELIFAVQNAYPGETRHQTALRYIQRAEKQYNSPEVHNE